MNTKFPFPAYIECCPYEQLLPEYMRATEAEQKLADGTLERQRAAKMARFRSR